MWEENAFLDEYSNKCSAEYLEPPTFALIRGSVGAAFNNFEPIIMYSNTIHRYLFLINCKYTYHKYTYMYMKQEHI